MSLVVSQCKVTAVELQGRKAVTIRCQRCDEVRSGQVAPALGVVEHSTAMARHGEECASEEGGTCSCGTAPFWFLRLLGPRQTVLAGLRSGRFRSPEFGAALGVADRSRNLNRKPLPSRVLDPSAVPGREEALRTRRVAEIPLLFSSGCAQFHPCRRCGRRPPRLNLAKLYAQAERAAAAGADLYR